MTPDLYLASASPRRAELLDQLGVHFEVWATHIDESRKPGEVVELFVERLAREKAHALLPRLDPRRRRPVLGSDTVVEVGGVPLGKPRDRDDFLAMFERLSGREHRVLTAVVMADEERTETRLSVSHVTFRELTRAEMERYWATGEPADKAGGYAIQGRAAQFVERLDGSYSGVMGLPLFETAQLLARFGIATL